MKKKIAAFLLLAILVLVCGMNTFAAGAKGVIVDDADLLSSGEEASLQEKLDEIASRQKVDLVVLLMEDTDGKSRMEFADDYYDYNGFSGDGIVFLVSMAERRTWFSTTGYGIEAFTDAGIDYIDEKVNPYLADGDYAGAVRAFGDMADDFLTQSYKGDPYDTGNLPKAPFKGGLSAIVAAVVGAIASLINNTRMKSQLKSVAKKKTAADYTRPGSLSVTRGQDVFLYRNVSRVRRQTENRSGGGSSIHTGSSGVSHGGGGGRHF